MTRHLLPLLLLALASAGICPAARAQGFVAPSDGNLYVKCTGGSAGATSQFGTGTNEADFKPLLTDLPRSCPSQEVLVAPVKSGQSLYFAISTNWTRQTYWAFSNRTDSPSTVAFTDICNSLGKAGSAIQPIGTNTWLLHLNDAAHYTVSQCEANNILIQLRLAPRLLTQAAPETIFAEMHDPATEDLARSYLAGAYDMVRNSRKSCAPTGEVPAEELEEVFSGYLALHPEVTRSGQNAAVVAAQAFAIRWPCGKHKTK